MGAQRRGVAVDVLLRRAGISPGLLSAPLARVSQGQYTALVRLLSRAMSDEFLGLLVKPLPLGTFASTCALMINCRTIDEAIRVGFASYHRCFDDFVARLQLEGDVARIRLNVGKVTNEADACHLYAQRIFLFFAYGMACWLAARPIPLLGVQYCDVAPNGTSDVPRLFHSRIEYGKGHTGLWFDARWLQLPVVQRSGNLTEFLSRAPMDLLVRFRDHSTVTARIRRLLQRHLHEEMPSLEEVGRSFAMTPQTLRRRLHDDGKRFQELKDDLRRDAAIEYLARDDLSLVQIAALLGFSEASTFHRAFKKWTGATPGEYRLGQGTSPQP